MKQFTTLIIIILTSFLLCQQTVHAEEKKSEDLSQTDMTDYNSDINYDEIQNVLGEVLDKEDEFNFSDYVNDLITGKKAFSITGIWNDMGNAVKGELKHNKNTMLRLITIAVIAALFTNFSNVFQNSQVAETAFYVTYLLLFSILTSSFLVVTSLASQTISNLLNFMKALIPTYFLSVAFSSGADTSMLFYESTLALITLVDYVLVGFVIPAINVYFILSLANNITKEDLLSKLAELLELIIQWTLKSLFGAVVGYNVIQGMIVPVANHVKNSIFLKAAGAIPGIGSTLSSVTETVFSAGILVKNAIGVAGLVVIITICAVPLVKLALYVIIYKFGAAIIQPVSEKRIMNCINASAQSAKLLLHAVFIGTVMLLFTIAIISASTNLRLG